jgi:ATP-binding cassette, subfamily B, bacterial
MTSSTATAEPIGSQDHFSGIRQILRHVGRVLRARWGMGLLILGGLFIEMAFNSAVAMSFKYLVDDAIVPRNEKVLFAILAGLTVGVVVVSAVGLGCDYLYAKFTTGVLNDLRWRMFTHLQRLAMNFFARSQAADILARFSTDLAAFENALELAVVKCVLPMLELVLSAGLLFALNWQLAIIAMLAVPVCLMGPRLITPRAVTAGYRAKQNQATASGAVQENILFQPVIKAFGLHKSMLERFADRIAHLAAASMKVSFLTSLIERSAGMGTLVLQVVVMAAGAYMAFHEKLSIGSLASFQALFVNFSYSLTILTQFYPTLIQAGAGMQRIQELLDEQPGVIDPPDAQPLPRLSREIQFKDVKFGYSEGQLNLEDINFVIRAGESVAFVGRSGSGKSTVLTLLIRFYEPDAGVVAFDGHDVRAASQDSLREQLGIVFQESILFDTSIRENIRIGKADATDAEIEAAARAAEIHDIIMDMPEGYDTVVGERGGRLSGGQRQRIAIARALLRDPCVLVLDQATSALDAATEASINKTLERAAKGRTVVSVTHRLASIVAMDRIFLLERGRMVEQGRHDELLLLGGVYYKLWEKQRGFVIAEGGQARVEASRLRSIPMLQSLDADVLTTLADIFITERCPAGRDVFREGDLGDKFYIVVRGTLSVWINTADGEQKQIRTMEDGNHFGEIALMEDVARTATVRTTTDCVFLTLSRDPFLKLLQREPKLRESFKKVVAERLEASATVLKVRASSR